MKTHLSFATTDIDASVAFYGTLLNVAPAKRLADYALFVTDDPGLELALQRTSRKVRLRGAHYGIVVAGTAGVDSAIGRLRAAGLTLDVRTGETCCYAKQNKVWTSDPDGRRWEVYTVLAESEASEPSACCA